MIFRTTDNGFRYWAYIDGDTDAYHVEKVTFWRKTTIQQLTEAAAGRWDYEGWEDDYMPEDLLDWLPER